MLTLVKPRVFLEGGLTRVPSVQKSVISDLFIWRKNEEWQTFFELLDINNLIDANYQQSEDNFATFVFYDKNGIQIGQEKIAVKPGRQTIDISLLIPETHTGYGTYACFHGHISPSISDSGSFIAERGYSGYKWKNLGARGYVHGNFDAIAKSHKGIEMLGTAWKGKLVYQLQHELTGPATYELVVVNPCNKTQNVEFNIIKQGVKIESGNKTRLRSRASFVKRVEVKEGEKLRFSITSRMYMARPVVFRLETNSMDVFHG